jgi:hypothetical protein
MKASTLAIGLALLMTTFYFIASFYISKIEKIKISPKTWDTGDIIEAVQNYDLNGVWFDKSDKFLSTVPYFHQRNGTVHVMLEKENRDISEIRNLNMTEQNQTGYYVDISLNDGYNALEGKFLFRLKMPTLNSTTGEIRVQRKKLSNYEMTSQDCVLKIAMKVIPDRAKKSNYLEDLSFIFFINSNDPSCEMDLYLNFSYNNNESNQGVFRFLIFGFLFGFYQMVLLLYIIIRIESNDNVCKYQGVVFWTSIGMFSCLFCFTNISGSAYNTEKFGFFLINSIISFVNFAIVILKILHRIGRVYLDNMTSLYVV